MLLLFSFSPTLTYDTTPQRTERLEAGDCFSWDRRRPRLHAFALVSTHDAVGWLSDKKKTRTKLNAVTIQYRCHRALREIETFTTPEMASFTVGDSLGWWPAGTPALPGEKRRRLVAVRRRTFVNRGELTPPPGQRWVRWRLAVSNSGMQAGTPAVPGENAAGWWRSGGGPFVNRGELTPPPGQR
jgi:hypothetical protein